MPHIIGIETKNFPLEVAIGVPMKPTVQPERTIVRVKLPLAFH